MAVPTEKSIQTAIRRWLKNNGWFVRKWHQGSYAGAGMPDLLAIKNGVVLFLEIKRPGGKLTKLQERTIRELSEHGANVFVVYSLKEVKAIVERVLL